MFAKRKRIGMSNGYLCDCSILALCVMCVRPTCAVYSAESFAMLMYCDRFRSAYIQITTATEKNNSTKCGIQMCSSKKRYFLWMAYLHGINTWTNHTRNSEEFMIDSLHTIYPSTLPVLPLTVRHILFAVASIKRFGSICKKSRKYHFATNNTQYLTVN